MAKPASAHKGEPEPRLYTQPLRKLTRKTSLGFEVIDYGKSIGVTLMPWQRRFLVRALELNPGGGFRFAVVLLLVSRQNGKTTVMRLLALWLMIHRPGSMVLGTSTSIELAREPWSAVADDAQEMGIAKRITRGSIDTSLWLDNGSRYKVASASRRGGRSLSVDLLLLDELREQVDDHDAWNALTATTTARPDPLIVALSNAGDDRSVVLNGLRARALDGQDPRLGIFEWSAPEGAELDDVAALAQANPALGHHISLSTLESKRSTMPPAGFRTEHLCQRVASLDGALDQAAWEDCADPGTLDSLRSKVVVGLDVCPDLSHVALVAAAPLDDGRVRIEVVAAWDSTETCRAELPALLARVKPRQFAWFPQGPAAAMAADLRRMPGSTEITNVPEVCQAFSEQVLARRVAHSDDPMLTAQALGASKAASGDGWRFTRKGAGHVTGVYAAAASVHVVRARQPRQGKVRVLLPSSA